MAQSSGLQVGQTRQVNARFQGKQPIGRVLEAAFRCAIDGRSRRLRGPAPKLGARSVADRLHRFRFAMARWLIAAAG